MYRENEGPNEPHGERIATLERQMQDLMGNGQPGRIRELENTVNGHNKLIWIASGVLVAGQVLLVLLHFFSPVVAKLPINP